MSRWQDDEAALCASGMLSRLEGVTQVQIGPGDHCNRLEHSFEVARLSHDLALRLGQDGLLARAIALGHDCGHLPFGHVGEEVVQAFVPGFDHATWGAAALAVRLDLSDEVLDGVRNHSWNRPTPRTPEADIVRWADRIAYLTRDFADAYADGLVGLDALPASVRHWAGTQLAEQRSYFCGAVASASSRTGVVCMEQGAAASLAAFRIANSRYIYQHPWIQLQGADAARALHLLFGRSGADAAGSELASARVSWVRWLASLDDGTALMHAKEHGHPDERIPDFRCGGSYEGAGKDDGERLRGERRSPADWAC